MSPCIRRSKRKHISIFTQDISIRKIKYLQSVYSKIISIPKVLKVVTMTVHNILNLVLQRNLWSQSPEFLNYDVDLWAINFVYYDDQVDTWLGPVILTFQFFFYKIFLWNFVIMNIHYFYILAPFTSQWLTWCSQEQPENKIPLDTTVNHADNLRVDNELKHGLK